MNKKVEDQDVTFASEAEGVEFAEGAGFTVTNNDGINTAGRGDMTRTFKIERNKAGRWEWK